MGFAMHMCVHASCIEARAQRAGRELIFVLSSASMALLLLQKLDESAVA